MQSLQWMCSFHWSSRDMDTDYQGQSEEYVTAIEICIEFVWVLFCREKISDMLFYSNS